MLGLDNYGSESESENEQQRFTEPQPSPALAPKTSKSSINLPPPSSNGTSASKVSLPPPKNKRAPKKFTIGLPALLKDDNEEKDDIELDRPAAKRQKTGAGASSLLSMLPAPKQKALLTGQSERVLGGGRGPGLVFNAKPSPVAATSSAITEGGDEEYKDDEEGAVEPSTRRPTSPTTAKDISSLPFLPPSIVKGKANISLEDKPQPPAKSSLQGVSAAPVIGLFSIGNSKPTTSSNSISNSPLPTLSSAPTIPTFEPPEPTPQDPYPGYYQLPSGGWATYNPEYYEGFRKKWQAEYDAYVRKLEKGAIKGFEGYEEGASEVDAMKEMEKAKLEVREREEKKALTKGATGPTAQPNMRLNPSKLSGIARSRHQLSTLLRDAYENRETLEEKIAEGRRNRKEAGNKYGF